jgi:acetylornithine/succinyldiaminopimelate/putrescine aminotransferase
MEAIDAPARAREAGERLTSAALAVPGVSGVRGLGLLLAVELDGLNAPAVAARCLEEGLVVNGVTPTAVRMAPPLVVEDAHIAEAMALFGSVLAAEREATGG